MPTYPFYCEKCKKSFELVLKLSDYEKSRSFRCPRCRSTRVHRQVTAFQTITSKKS